jgi:hypothetical protein
VPLALEPENGHRYTPTEIRTMIRQAILSAHDRGVRALRPSDFAPIVGIVGDEGLRPPTLTKILGELCQGDAPLLRRAESRGVYDIITATPQHDPALTAAPA